VRAVTGAVSAAAVVIGLGLTPAAAATATWTVTPGGKFYTFSTLADYTVLTETTTGARFECGDFTVSGTLKSEAGWLIPSARSPQGRGRPAAREY
jgi:hypothetical protein